MEHLIHLFWLLGNGERRQYHESHLILLETNFKLHLFSCCHFIFHFIFKASIDCLRRLFFPLACYFLEDLQIPY